MNYFGLVVLLWFAQVNLYFFLSCITLIELCWSATCCRTNSLPTSSYQWKTAPSLPVSWSFSLELILVTGVRVHYSAASWSELKWETVYKPLPSILLEAKYTIHEKVLGWHSHRNLRNNPAFLFLESVPNIPVPHRILEQRKRRDLFSLLWWARLLGCCQILFGIPTLSRQTVPILGAHMGSSMRGTAVKF